MIAREPAKAGDQDRTLGSIEMAGDLSCEVDRSLKFRDASRSVGIILSGQIENVVSLEEVGSVDRNLARHRAAKHVCEIHLHVVVCQVELEEIRIPASVNSSS